MRRRAKRDLGILVGAIAILGVIVFFNGQMGRSRLVDEMESWRQDAEKQRTEDGLDLLSWNIMRQTKGTLRKGGSFHEELYLRDQQPVNLMGYMVPQEQFRDVTEFLFLPLPIECYYCQIPPERDVMLVRLKEGLIAQIYEEPVLVNGSFNLHEGPGVKYFYTITEAAFGPGEIDGTLNRRRLDPKHFIPDHEPTDDLRPAIPRSFSKD